jgi:hypothetical protein
MENHTNIDYSHHWYIRIRLQCSHIFRRDMQNHTHRDYSQHWYIRTRLQCGHIFMTRYAKSHTHRSSSQVVDLVAHGHSTSSIFVDGLESWFLACNGSKNLPSLTCTFGLQEHSASGRRKNRKNNDHWTQDEGLFILKTMIIGNRMKLFILMPGGSGLPSPDTVARKEYVTRILMAAMLEGWATQSPLSQEFF